MEIRHFTPFPVLKTKRLTLRQLSTDDQDAIFALRSDTEINKYLDRQPSKTIEDAVKFIHQVNDNIQKNNSLYWVITLTETKEFVGTICLFNFSTEKNSCEIGYELTTIFQRHGIMREAITKVIDYAFQTIRLQQIQAYTHTANNQSTKLLEQLSFIQKIQPDTGNPEIALFTLTNSPT
jgi:ribosomal-protein-alanine N-acetyltransferase